jgi:PIN domain nuclease of toxin-antitoxin system
VIRVLLDTHVLLWALYEPRKLSKKTAELITDPENVRLISSVTAWEVATKYRAGKLEIARPLVENYFDQLATFMAEELPVTSAHALLAGGFKQGHKDPFDRLLVAQSVLEGIPLISNDEVLEQFPVNLIW